MLRRAEDFAAFLPPLAATALSRSASIRLTCKVEHLAFDLEIGDAVENGGCRPDLVIEFERVRDEPPTLHADDEVAHSAEEESPGERGDLPGPHAFAYEAVGGGRRHIGRHHVIGTVEIDGVDFAAGEEAFDGKRLVGLGYGRGHLLRFEEDILVLRGFEPLDLIFARDRLSRVLVDELAMHAVPGLAVQGMEGDAFRGRGRGVQRDRTRKFRDLQVAFPDRP